MASPARLFFVNTPRRDFLIVVNKQRNYHRNSWFAIKGCDVRSKINSSCENATDNWRWESFEFSESFAALLLHDFSRYTIETWLIFKTEKKKRFSDQSRLHELSDVIRSFTRIFGHNFGVKYPLWLPSGRVTLFHFSLLKWKNKFVGFRVATNLCDICREQFLLGSSIFLSSSSEHTAN